MMSEDLIFARRLPDLDLVADWLACLPTDDPEMLRKLERVSWDDAVTLTDQWHARLAKRMSWKASAAELAEGTRAVLELPDGWRWVRLETKEALDREGEAMGHCVGQGGYDWLLFFRSSDVNGIYSLRDARGMPHVTLHVTDGEVRQAMGKANAAPSGHARRLAALVESLGVGIGDEPPGLFEMAYVSDRLIPVSAALALLAAGPIDGDVDLRKSEIRTLPADMEIEGDLDLRGCTSLKSLSDGLRVGGDLFLDGSSSLESLPEGLKVGGTLYLRRCISLKRLPEHMEVGKNLYPLECVALEFLPDGLKVDGSLNLYGCKSLEALPEGLVVRDNLYLVGCSSLTWLPDRLSVGGNVIGAEHLCQRRGMGM
jgi:hypothetical protein